MSRHTASILLLVAVTVIPILALSWVAYAFGNRELGGFILDRVESVNALKAKKVETVFSDASKQTAIFSNSESVKSEIVHLAEYINDRTSGDFASATRILDQSLPDARQIHGYEDIKLVSQKGVVVYTANAATSAEVGTAAEGHLLEAFREGQKGLKINGIFLDEDSLAETTHYSVYISKNLSDDEGSPIGVVITEVSLTSLLAEITESTGLSATGETYLAKDDGRAALFLSPLREDQNAPLSRTVTFGDANDVAIQAAVRGQAGRGEGKNYNETPVLAAWQNIPVVNWGIVTAIHSKEAFTPVWRLRNLLVVMNIALLLLVVPMLILMLRWLFLRPLRELGAVAEQIDHNEPSPQVDKKLLYSHDMYGELATHLHNIANKIAHLRTLAKDADSGTENDLTKHDHPHAHRE